MCPANDASPGTGSQHHREAVQNAAARLFTAKGFTATGVREIAAEAGIDPALVIRYFGSKEKLFLRTMTMSSAFADLMSGPLDGLGASIVDFVLRRTRGPVREADGGESAGERGAGQGGAGATEHMAPTGVFVALLRASDRPTVRAHLADSVEEMFVARVAGRLPGDDADLRARLLAAQVTGLMTALYVVEDPGLLAARHEDLVRHYGRAMQLLIDGD